MRDVWYTVENLFLLTLWVEKNSAAMGDAVAGRRCLKVGTILIEVAIGDLQMSLECKRSLRRMVRRSEQEQNYKQETARESWLLHQPWMLFD